MFFYLCFVLVSCNVEQRNREDGDLKRRDSLTINEAITIGLEIEEAREDLNKKMKKSDSVINRLMNDIENQLKDR